MRSFTRCGAPALALMAVLTLAACSDDDNPAGGGSNTDTTPPSVSSVTAIDAGHIEVVFSEEVTRASAENTANYAIVTAAVAFPASTSAVGGGLSVVAAALSGDGKKVTLSTAPPMLSTGYSINIHDIVDRSGNKMGEGVDRPFDGSTGADNTDPVLVYRKPGAGATNQSPTAVIELTFSEPIQASTLEASFGLTGNQGVVPVGFTTTDDTHFYGGHDPLQLNTEYQVVIHGVLDYAGNALTHTAWSFTTTSTADKTPPTLVSSVPANLATNVDVNAVLSLTFSEAIAPDSFTPFFTPEVAGSGVWSPDGKTLTFTPATTLAAGTQYDLAILPGDVMDLAGNRNTALFSRVFTTGPVLEDGSIAGTITGDANSTAAGDPTGAFVGAADAFPFAGGAFSVFGITTVAGNNTYQSKYLRDGTYYPLCVKETNNDGWLDPFLGDAVGFYGINFVAGDTVVATVDIIGGSHETGINFPIYDPTSVYGEVYYEGVHGGESHAIFIGLFAAAGFDPNNPGTPVAATEAYWPEPTGWVINSIDVGPIPNGNYYVGAFLDVNDSGNYEPGTDPAGLLGGNSPRTINLSHGSDATNIEILMLDPLPGLTATGTNWGASPHAAWLKELSRAVRGAKLAQQH